MLLVGQRLGHENIETALKTRGRLHPTAGGWRVGRQPGGGGIKPFVIGRKNFFFANTPLGVQACAVIYSLIETVKELGPDPFLYLTGVLDTAPALDRTVEGCAAAPG